MFDNKVRKMKYYGIKEKIRKDKARYRYAKTKAKLFSILSLKHKQFWKMHYQQSFCNQFALNKYDNSIPKGKNIQLNHVIFADIIKREDTKKLQSGLRRLLKEYRSSRYFTGSIEGVEEICARIGQMDTLLFAGYHHVDCGIFEFREPKMSEIVRWFTVVIKYFNSDYLMVQFEVCFSEQKAIDLTNLMSCNYSENFGYVQTSLTAKHNQVGAFKTHVVSYYNNDALKSDKIYEFISCIEWQFYDKLKAFFPFVIHNKGIIPPRIEVYKTVINYRKKLHHFWHSIGIAPYNGHFLDVNQKVFFRCEHSSRYDNYVHDSRVLYIFKDSNDEEYGFLSTESILRDHLKFVETNLFKLLILKIMSEEAGKVIVKYNHELDIIKLRKRNLKKLIKRQYQFIRDYDFYNRLIMNIDWDIINEKLRNEYSDSYEQIRKNNFRGYTTYKYLFENTKKHEEEIQSNFILLKEEYSSKRNALQNLFDYKNSSKDIRLNILMLIISVITLLFVVFPGRAEWIANIIRRVYQFILGLFQ